MAYIRSNEDYDRSMGNFSGPSKQDRIDSLDTGFCNPMKIKMSAEDEADILAEDD